MRYWNIVVTIWNSCYSWQYDVIRAKKREKELQICNLLFSKYELNIIPICQNNPKKPQNAPIRTSKNCEYYSILWSIFSRVHGFDTIYCDKRKSDYSMLFPKNNKRLHECNLSKACAFFCRTLRWWNIAKLSISDTILPFSHEHKFAFWLQNPVGCILYSI